MRDSHPLRLDMAETLKFLLIEDDEDDYVLARDLLNRAFAGRHTLDWIDDWELALETIVRNEHDACLVDYRLGKKDGLGLVQCAVERGCDVPIILLTGLDHRDIDIEAMKAGAADYLVKGTISPTCWRNRFVTVLRGNSSCAPNARPGRS